MLVFALISSGMEFCGEQSPSLKLRAYKGSNINVGLWRPGKPLVRPLLFSRRPAHFKQHPEDVFLHGTNQKKDISFGYSVLMVLHTRCTDKNFYKLKKIMCLTVQTSANILFCGSLDLLEVRFGI